MTTSKFDTLLQRYVVNAGIDVTVLPGQPSPPGTMQAAHSFLYDLDLSEFRDPSMFQHLLDEKTEALRRSFPATGQFWGRARKCMNIFLRNSTYSYYLRERYTLSVIEPFLEMPLDAKAAKGLTRDTKNYNLGTLPKWDAIIRLTAETNDLWQALASQIAQRKDTYRVHLDLCYWQRDVDSAR
jgi:hypothetical protein